MKFYYDLPTSRLMRQIRGGTLTSASQSNSGNTLVLTSDQAPGREIRIGPKEDITQLQRLPDGAIRDIMSLLEEPDATEEIINKLEKERYVKLRANVFDLYKDPILKQKFKAQQEDVGKRIAKIKTQREEKSSKISKDVEESIKGLETILARRQKKKNIEQKTKSAIEQTKEVEKKRLETTKEIEREKLNTVVKDERYKTKLQDAIAETINDIENQLKSINDKSYEFDINSLLEIINNIESLLIQGTTIINEKEVNKYLEPIDNILNTIDDISTKVLNSIGYRNEVNDTVMNISKIIGNIGYGNAFETFIDIEMMKDKSPLRNWLGFTKNYSYIPTEIIDKFYVFDGFMIKGLPDDKRPININSFAYRQYLYYTTGQKDTPFTKTELEILKTNGGRDNIGSSNILNESSPIRKAIDAYNKGLGDNLVNYKDKIPLELKYYSYTRNTDGYSINDFKRGKTTLEGMVTVYKESLMELYDDIKPKIEKAIKNKNNDVIKIVLDRMQIALQEISTSEKSTVGIATNKFTGNTGGYVPLYSADKNKLKAIMKTDINGNYKSIDNITPTNYKCLCIVNDGIISVDSDVLFDKGILEVSDINKLKKLNSDGSRKDTHSIPTKTFDEGYRYAKYRPESMVVLSSGTMKQPQLRIPIDYVSVYNPLEKMD